MPGRADDNFNETALRWRKADEHITILRVLCAKVYQVESISIDTYAINTVYDFTLKAHHRLGGVSAGVLGGVNIIPQRSSENDTRSSGTEKERGESYGTRPTHRGCVLLFFVVRNYSLRPFRVSLLL
jgi:hypothetical protein